MIPAPRPKNNRFSRLARVEESILGLFLVLMILLACVQILLRTVFSSGLTWADPLLRYLVLWSGLLGAVMATSQGKHLSLDIISFLVPKPLHAWLHVITNLFSATVAAFLTWAAYLFIHSEMEFGNTQLLSVPSWAWNLIFPIAFALITLRFLLAAWTTVLTILSMKKSLSDCKS
jgi:TRAP-type C4-dicarboxylate transport system permease small subunit